ncbi:hypothetical protein O4H49_14465 [Kiloniella laminariae]|uniref:Uncharacterized protein n=1 Tax=Kiloniella laminariae TaxID=454162 RepID=A0ABT4LLM7_9PROT|nr:hypothetical protein [Kiloniella laminariae]MCZ4281991.1 hypothetical protein [Kiloniella laminariae]
MSFIDSIRKVRRNSDEVKVGGSYRYIGPHRVIETAKVLKVQVDTFGIPHVHFSISVDGDHLTGFEDYRTLGISSFSERYRQAV